MNNLTKINLPYNLKTTIWKKNYNGGNINCVLTSSDKKYKLCINSNKKYLFIDKWSNSIQILKNKPNCFYNKTNNLFDCFLKSWNSFFFQKIKFKGKGFRIKFFKRIKLIKFYFGRSHKTFMLLKNIKRKRINKYKFMLIGLTKTNVMRNSINIIKIKPINIYTLRGLRLSKQIIFKRKGKKGTYI